MTITDKTKDEKPQYDMNRKAAKISALSSRRTDEYEYLTGEEILPSNRSQIREQAKSTYSPSGKTLGKQTEKQIDTLKYLHFFNKTDDSKQIVFLKKLLNDLIIYKL